MDNLTFIRKKLLENILTNILLTEGHKNNILFDTSNSVFSTSHCYFSTDKLVDFIKRPFSIKNGLCYAFDYSGKKLRFVIVVSKKHLNNDAFYNLVVSSFNLKPNCDKAVINSYDVCDINIDDSLILEAVSLFLKTNFHNIENNFLTSLNDLKQNDIDVYEEGAVITAEITKYERNLEARKKCIEHHGAICTICGFDFKKIYGDDFEGMIEVHHKVPLHTIKHDYVVDPINDLIPICPNCHAAIHHKKDGFYSVEEIKTILNKKNNK